MAPGEGALDDAEREELERLRAEVDDLRAEASGAAGGRGGGRARRRARWTVAVALVVLASLLAPVTLVARYARDELLDTDKYVATVAPLAEDPALQAAVTDIVTTRLMDRLDVEDLARQALDALTEQGAPDAVTALAVPLADQVEGFVRTQVARFLATQAFADLWEQANRAAHTQLDAALTGSGDGVVSTDDGVVREVLDVTDVEAGAPLPPEGFDWVRGAVGPDVMVSSISGGTDVCTAFVGGCPIVPVRRGEISCRYLGAAVEAFAPDGTSLVGEQGELVVTAPLPSMPVGFWGDPDGSRYRAAYFARHPGVWTHGDWLTVFDDGACVITGRSDATLNRGGVRMGTAELYSVVEALPEVADSLVVHLEDTAGGGPGRLLLFVAPAAGHHLDDELRATIRAALRRDLSPRHIPDAIEEVPGVPRTLSGKKLEVPVKRILLGADPDTAASRGSLANPESLDAFGRFAP